MSRRSVDLLRRHRGIAAVTALQAGCALYFIFDVASEVPGMRTEPAHPMVELTAVIALLIGTALGLRELRRLTRRNDRVESSLRAARGAFSELMEESFARWGLTPSERDVALLTIKGMSVAEIAVARRSQPGTVKAQSSAIYRKAGVEGRAGLLGCFIEDLMTGETARTPKKQAMTSTEPASRAAGAGA